MDQILKLPQNADGQFLLTKEAVNVIRKASYIMVRYQKGKKTECYLRAILEDGDMYATFSMPINVQFNGELLLSTIACIDKHPLQILIRENIEIFFSCISTPVSKKDINEEIIFFNVKINDNKFVKGIFSTKVSETNSPHRMIVI